MKKFLVVFVLFLSVTNFKVRADDRVCHVIDSAINMSFSTNADGGFFNCFQLESFGPTDNLKIISSSFGMKNEVNVYNHSGVQVEQMRTDVDDYQAKEFNNFTSNDKKIIDIKPNSVGIEEVEVKVSYLIEKNGKHIFIISTQLAEKSGGKTTPKPPVCAPGKRV